MPNNPGAPAEQSVTEQSVTEQSVTEQSVVVRANYQVFVLALLFIQLFNSVAIVMARDPQVQEVTRFAGLGISTYLFADAIYRLVQSPDRWRFLFRFHGYLLLIGSLPIPFAALFGLAWYWFAVTKLRRADFADMGKVVIRKRAQSTLLVAVLAAIVVLEMSSILIVKVEESADDALIVTAGDAIWWSLVTMATVGYGDMYPVTTAGRVVAVFAIVVGFSLFSVLTSFLAQSFMQPSGVDADIELVADDGQSDNRLSVHFPTDSVLTGSVPADNELADAIAGVEAIRQYLDQQEAIQQKSFEALQARLARLEDRLNVAESDR